MSVYEVERRFSDNIRTSQDEVKVAQPGSEQHFAEKSGLDDLDHRTTINIYCESIFG